MQAVSWNKKPGMAQQRKAEEVGSHLSCILQDMRQKGLLNNNKP